VTIRLTRRLARGITRDGMSDGPSPQHDTPATESAPSDQFLCPNCGRENQGDFCAGCGQKRIHDGDLSLAHAWHHVVHELFHLDGKILVSLKLLFIRPGQLTLDFLEGRRARHVHPIQLFLFISVAFYFFLHVSFDLHHVFNPDRVPPRVMAKLDARAQKTGVTLDEFLAQRSVRIEPKIKAAFIGDFVLNGCWLALLFRKPRRYLAEHMVMALHLACFGMVLASTLGWLVIFQVGNWVTVPLLYAIGLAYPLLAFRRVYGGSWGSLVFKMIVMEAIRMVILAGLVLAIIVHAITH
jgi:hypothetical protein